MADTTESDQYPNQRYGWVRENDGTWSLYSPDGTLVIASRDNRAQVSEPTSDFEIANRRYVLAHGGVLSAKTTTLANADILALAGTPVELVPAQGTGTVVLPVYGVLRSVLVTGYTGITIYDPATNPGNGGICFALDALNNFNQVTGWVAASTLLNFNNRSFWVAMPCLMDTRSTGTSELNSPLWGDPIRDLGGFENAALSIGMGSNSGGPIAGGNAGNSLTVTVLYYVLSI